jgi:hypothetical protein
MESKFKSSILGKLANATPVVTGTKASTDVKPVLNVNGIPNKFSINKLAAEAMGLEVGSRVRIFDLGTESPINERFVITKVADDDNSAAKCAATNSNTKATKGIDLAFNYSGVWAILVQGTEGAVNLSYEALCEAEYVIAGKTSGGNNRYRATNKIKMDIEPIGNGIIAGVEYDNLFVLTNYKATPKTAEELQSELKEKPATKASAPAVEGKTPAEEEGDEDLDFEDEE